MIAANTAVYAIQDATPLGRILLAVMFLAMIAVIFILVRRK